MSKILIVEDDVSIGNLIEELLKEKYSVDRAYSGSEAILQFKNNNYDLVLLDLMLPGLNGEEVLKRIKNKTKVIILSAKSDQNSKVSNLVNGANDFISKPFDNDELLARIDVQLRTGQEINQNVYSYRDLVLDTNQMNASINGNDLHLTKLEYGIFEFLVKNPNMVFSKNQIFEAVWNYDSLGTEESVKVHISSIRTKIEKYTNEKYIETIWGIGFKFIKG